MQKWNVAPKRRKDNKKLYLLDENISWVAVELNVNVTNALKIEKNYDCDEEKNRNFKF